MLEETFLGWLVVIRRNRQDTVGAEALHLARLFADTARVVAAGARDNRNLAAGLLQRKLDDAGMLLGGQHRAFSGRPTGNQKIDSRLQLAADQAAQSRLVERVLRLERSDQSRAATAKLIQFHIQHLLQSFRIPHFPARVGTKNSRIQVSLQNVACYCMRPACGEKGIGSLSREWKIQPLGEGNGLTEFEKVRAELAKLVRAVPTWKPDSERISWNSTRVYEKGS